MTNDKEITLADMFDHMRGQTITIEGLSKKMDAMEKRIMSKLTRLESGQALLFTQTKNIVDELDDVETVQLPKIRKSVRTLSKRLSNHIKVPSHQPALKS